MKIIFASLNAYGHLYPMMPLALACAGAGHEVLVATGEPFLSRLPLPTAAGLPAGGGLESVMAETMRRHPEAHGLDFMLAMFGDITAEAVIATVLPLFERVQPDLVVYESMNVGVGVAASVLGIPAATFAIGLFQPAAPMLHRATIGFQQAQWEHRGQSAPVDDLVVAGTYVDPVPASLQDTSAIPNRLPIRPVAWSETTGTLPAWLTEPRTRPRAYLTLGTVSFGAVEVLRQAVTETAAQGVDVLVAVGPEGDPAALGELPDGVHVERFVDQSAVLPLVDLVVHHGGTGTMLGVLAAGLPQLILPQGADQFHNGATITRVGAGQLLHNDDQLPGAIGERVAALLGASPEHTTAGRIRDEIAALPAPADVVATLVEFALR
jgi:UDP:flavonoid glycosyltransferase YjiC (YdhE family)